MKISDAYEEYASRSPSPPRETRERTHHERRRAARHNWVCTSSVYEQSTHRCSQCLCVKVTTRHVDRRTSVKYIMADGQTYQLAPACPRKY